MRILIADDNRDSAESTAELIRFSLPCDIVIAHDGHAALDQIATWRPDAMVLDLYMPGLDGIAVSRRARRLYPFHPPYMIALTGQPDAVRHLGAIDEQFDRVLAKPLDVDQLIDSLVRLAQGDVALAREPAAFELGELFTRAARQVAPLAAARQLSFSFDYSGPGVTVVGDTIDVQRGVHRLLLGAVDMLSAGFLLFSAEVSLDAGGHCSVVVETAGSGRLQPPAAIEGVLQRLLLTDTSEAAAEGQPAGDVLARSAYGLCPSIGAPVAYSGDGHSGFLLRAQWTHDGAQVEPASRCLPAHAERAWLIDEEDVPSAWLYRRLQRAGWAARRFATCADALGEVALGGDAEAAWAPRLLVIVETRSFSIEQVALLQAALPASTHCVLAVRAGSERLVEPGDVPGVELRVYPFGPRDLADFSVLAKPGAATVADAAAPSEMAFEDRPLVLLVDDNEINRIVGSGLVQALGYEVKTANDGLDAIDQCRRAPPELVLMDLDMPVMKGLDAALRLRALQRSGNVPLFPIIAATAAATEAARAACLQAGMDGFLSKPLELEDLQAQLRRFMVPR